MTTPRTTRKTPSAKTSPSRKTKNRWSTAQKAAARKGSGPKERERSDPRAPSEPRKRPLALGKARRAEDPRNARRAEDPRNARRAEDPRSDGQRLEQRSSRRDERRLHDARPHERTKGAESGHRFQPSPEPSRYKARRKVDGGAKGNDQSGQARRSRGDRAPRVAADLPERESMAQPRVEVSADNGFAGLGVPSVLVERLARDSITTPFPIQQATIPDALAGRDVLGRGQTGSGKTLAFALPTLARLAGSRSRSRRPRALVLVPTRELAMQVSDAIQPLAHVIGVKHKLIAGGMPYQPQLDALDRGVDILIATPGRMNDLVSRGAAVLDAVEVAVLDEADHMAEMGFLPEVTALLDLIPPGGQRLLFSATLDRGVDTIVERYLNDPVTHEADPSTASVSTMDHHVLLVEPQHKQPLTAELASRPGRTLVFVRTKLGADRVAMQLRQKGVVAAALHGGLAQGQRNRVLGAFKSGRIPVLVATDVAARGIHVDDVSAVIQVDPPADHKDYLHRSGRTARAGERGAVVTLALPHQRATMRRLTREAGLEIQLKRTAPGDIDLRDATGSTAPTGEPLSESAFQKMMEGEPKKRRFQGGPRRRPRPR